MPLFPAGFVDDLKSHLDIVQVVGERVPLRKAGGASFKGLCPFHGEKTPSFNVHSDKQFFHCFGCGVSGDVIKFVQLSDTLTFPDAVRQLAGRAGIPVPEPEDAKDDRENSREREALLKAHEVAAGWFKEQLAAPVGAPARRLLSDRGMTAETIELLGMGFAPAAGGLRARLMKDGFSEPLLLKSGLLVSRDEGAARDRFRNRLMIPIYRDNGAIVAFGGRAMTADQQPKYLQLARNGDLRQGPDPVRAQPLKNGHQPAEIRRPGRGVFRLGPGLPGRYHQRGRLIGDRTDSRSGATVASIRRESDSELRSGRCRPGGRRQEFGDVRHRGVPGQCRHAAGRR